MKKVLGAIGKFFKKIWDWIKETAWIQPLLIVGIIFGIIMGIKPTISWIQDITQVETESTFYDDNKVSYEKLVEKVNKNGDNDVLIVIFIKEENETCEQCVSQQKDFDEFFSSNHETAEDGRNYSVAVLDIAADEFDEDEVDDDEILRDVSDDVIELWNLANVWDEMPTKYNAPSGTQEETIDVNSSDPLPTPTIARFDANVCVGVAMGFDNDDDLFTLFCFADDVNDNKPFEKYPGM